MIIVRSIAATLTRLVLQRPCGALIPLSAVPRPAAAKRRLGLGYRISAPAGLNARQENCHGVAKQISFEPDNA
jgi:hypothetical protein